jgi:hypothetical protein
MVISMPEVNHDWPGKMVKLEGVAAPRGGVAVFELFGELDRSRVEERGANRDRVFERQCDEIKAPHFAAVAAVRLAEPRDRRDETDAHRC